MSNSSFDAATARLLSINPAERALSGSSHSSRDQPLGGEKPGREIALALHLGQHARRVREDRFGRHGDVFPGLFIAGF